MKDEIQQISNKKVKELYTAMWGNNEFAESIAIRKSPYGNGLSNNSYMFDT